MMPAGAGHVMSSAAVHAMLRKRTRRRPPISPRLTRPPEIFGAAQENDPDSDGIASNFGSDRIEKMKRDYPLYARMNTSTERG